MWRPGGVISQSTLLREGTGMDLDSDRIVDFQRRIVTCTKSTANRNLYERQVRYVTCSHTKI